MLSETYRREQLFADHTHWAGFRTASLGLRQLLAGSPRRQAESSSSSYGLAVLLPLLSTPSHDDAVTFGYKVQTNFDEDLHLTDSIHLQTH